MRLSVCIPTYKRPDRIASCVRALARQTLEPGGYEVIVGIDGPDEVETQAQQQILPGAIVIDGPHAGPAATRNRMLDRATGDLLVLFNDDVEPAPDCLARHLEAHEQLAARNIRAMVVGSAPWKVHEPDRLFDRLIRESSMVFFYDQMTPERNPEACADPMHDWGFRHAWTLNFSMPLSMAREAGGFDASLPRACFEDLEFAWRVARRCNAGVLYRPGASVLHDHRYEPEGYLARERTLGAQSFALATSAPECARAIFGRDLTSPDELRYSLEFVRRESQSVRAIGASFLQLANIPSGEIRGPHQGALISALYEHHLPLKRWHWRLGLLEASGMIEPGVADGGLSGRGDQATIASASPSPAPHRPSPLAPASSL